MYKMVPLGVKDIAKKTGCAVKHSKHTCSITEIIQLKFVIHL